MAQCLCLLPSLQRASAIGLVEQVFELVTALVTGLSTGMSAMS